MNEDSKTLTMHNIIQSFCAKYDGDWDKVYHAIKSKERLTDDEIKELIGQTKSKFVAITDDEYPEKFKNIYRPPFGLFYYGDLSLIDKDCISIVGSRECCDYAIKECTRFTKELCKNLVVVSGMAKGIDTVAHQTTINYGGKTIAVLGSGIDNCYPSNNGELYNILKENHLVISEYPGLSKPEKEHFPFRNRIITSLSDALLVCEAKQNSGSLISIRYACEMGKDVYCIPYANDEIHVSNTVIKDGAYLAENPRDILHTYRIE